MSRDKKLQSPFKKKVFIWVKPRATNLNNQSLSHHHCCYDNPILEEDWNQPTGLLLVRHIPAPASGHLEPRWENSILA